MDNHIFMTYLTKKSQIESTIGSMGLPLETQLLVGIKQMGLPLKTKGLAGGQNKHNLSEQV